MGAVFEAEGAPGVGKRAIKMLRQEFVREEQVLARFFAEAQATRTLNHPNVTQVLETGTAENGTPYLVMELLEGVPVSSYVDQGQALPVPQAVHIVHGVLQALAAAHARSIVHRDIKPDNLFLVQDGNGSFHTKVLDFGIAKIMDLAGGMGQRTRTGVLLGTPGYMSPEQIQNSKGVDARSDLWSVGIIFYELLTGTSPFPAPNDFARLSSVLTEEMRPIEEVAPHLAAWSGFFVRALAKDPARRFQSAEEMAATLLAGARGPQAAPNPGILHAPSSWQPPSSLLQPPSSLMASSAMPMQGASVMHPPAAHLQSGVMTAPSMQHVVAVSQGSIPPPRPTTIALEPSFDRPSQISSNAVNVSPTHVSAQPPQGAAMAHGGHAHGPSIEVIDGTRGRGGVSWVVVGVIAFVALGLGFVLGMLVG